MKVISGGALFTDISNIRMRNESIEEKTLSKNACLSINSKGRATFEEEDVIRTCFQRDRDRIIHCNAFRRLKHKTQVFLSPEGDHYRTRLTHTLEVSQIARTVSLALLLNEDLTEAIALGHDLGHTPFGHAGERALNECFDGGFTHYEQSVRVVQKLEKHGRGLNLTAEVIDGIKCHTTGKPADTLEGRVVKFADHIAYINHDIDDAVRAGVLKEEDIPSDIKKTLGDRRSVRINTLVQSLVETSSNDIVWPDKISDAFERLHDFMFANVYRNPIAKGQLDKAEQVVKMIFKYFIEHPDEIPKDYDHIVKTEGEQRAICDFISNMSDRFAVELYNDLFVPYSWKY